MSTPTSKNPTHEAVNSNSLPAITINPDSTTTAAGLLLSATKKKLSAKFKSSLSENNIKIPNCNNNKNRKFLCNKTKNWKATISDPANIDEGERANESEPEAGNSNSDQGMDQGLKDDQEATKINLVNNSLKNDSSPLKDENDKDNSKDMPTAPKSSPTLNYSKPGPSSSKHSWSNFESSPKNRKGRKERKERKKGITYQNKEKAALGGIMKDSKNRSDEPEIQKSNPQQQSIEDEEDYVYKYNFFPKNSKSVVFTNDVLVVYFNGDDVVCECNEPLKKEVEQQVRNKEMRRGHLIKAQEKYNLCLF